jgi:hypothetical protein
LILLFLPIAFEKEMKEIVDLRPASPFSLYYTPRWRDIRGLID